MSRPADRSTQKICWSNWVKRVKPIKILTLLAAAFLAAAPAFAQSQDDDPVFAFHETDPAMNAAIQTALSYLPVFLEQMSDGEGRSIDGAFVKVAVPTPGQPTDAEHVWVGPFAFIDDRFAGALASHPAYFSHTAQGEVLHFSRNQISDWGVLGSDGLRYGYFTSRVVIETLPADEAAAYDGFFSSDPLPVGWE